MLRLDRPVIRLGFIIALVAAIGLGLSGLAAYRVHQQELAIGNIALARAIDIHATQIQDRLTERELLGRVAAGLFRAPATLRGDMLEPLRSSIYAFKADFVLASWVARVTPDDIPSIEQALREAGYPRPAVRSFDDGPLQPTGEPLDILLDVEPRTPEAMSYVGRDIGGSPVVGPLFDRAMREGKPLATDPFPIMKADGPLGIALVSPVLQSGSGSPVGFVTFSYELGPLLLANDDSALFSVTLRDPRNVAIELIADRRGAVSERPVGAVEPVMTRTETFGGRDWLLSYYPRQDTFHRAQQMAAMVGAIGLALTGIICGLFGYVAYNNIRLRREIAMRIGFEERLTAVIDELNHRVKNILAVIQSIVTRTMRHGADMDVTRDLLIGRIHAMSHVISLLSDSQWQGVKLKGLFESRAIPHAERIAVNGPDIVVSARAAQSLSLLFFELASHADEGLSLVGKHPNIVAQWEIAGEGPDAIFHFRWEEFNTSAKTRREESDFGVILLDRVAPEALGGSSKRYFTDVSYVYEVTAPVETVMDIAERGRTEQFAQPVRPMR